ncbi:MAG: hypothetical protein KGM43_11100, partial [Planctomycetota bacterium]|nr:hypothetical protein [Planctomycetota bacterium]
SGTTLNVLGITRLNGGGTINVDVNGSITLTEYVGTGVMRLGSVISTGSNIVLNVPGVPAAGADLLLVPNGTLTADLGMITMNAGGNVTIGLGSLVQALTTVTINGDVGNVNPPVGTVIDVNSGIVAPIVTINGNVNNDTFNIEATAAISTVTINGNGGVNTFNFGSKQPLQGGIVDNLLGTEIVNGSGSDTLNVDDTGSTLAKTGALAGYLTSTTLTGLNMGAGGITYHGQGFVNVNLGSGGNTFTIESTITGQTNVNSGLGNDVVNVRTTAGPTTVNTGGGVNTINVGSLTPAVGGIVDGIQGPLVIVGSGPDTANIDDTGSIVAKSGTLTSTTLTGLQMGASGITYSGLKILQISLGSGGNTFLIASTHKGQTILNSGAGGDVVNVQTISGPTLIFGQTGNDVFNIGSLAPAVGGTVGLIGAALSIDGGAGVNTINFDDTGSAVTKSGTLTATQLTGVDMKGSLAYANITQFNISLGAGGSTITIDQTYPTTNTVINDGTGNDIINVLGTSGPLTINGTHARNTFSVGSPGLNSGGILKNIQGPLVLHGSGTDTLNFDDSSNSTGVTGTLTSTALNGLGMGGSGVVYDGISTFGLSLGKGGDTLTVASTIPGTNTIDTGTGNGVFNIRTISGPTTLDSSFAPNTINVGTLAPANVGTLGGIGATRTLKGGQYLDVVNLDDTGDASNAGATLTSTTLTGLGMAGSIAFTHLSQMNLNLGGGSNVVQVLGSSQGQTTVNAGNGNTIVVTQAIQGPTTVNFGSGSNVLAVGSTSPTPGGTLAGISAALVVNGGTGSNALYLDDGGDAASRSGSITPTTLTGLGMTGGITYHNATTVNLTLGSGANNFTIAGTSTAPTTITAGNGNNIFNVQANTGPLEVVAGTGNNTFVVGSPVPGGRTLSGLAGTVALVPGSGNNTLNVDNTGDTAARAGVLNATALTGLGIGSQLIYVNMNTLNLRLGQGNDTFTLDGFAAQTTSATIDGWAGANTFSAAIAGNFTTHLELLNFAEVTSFVVTGDLIGQVGVSPITQTPPPFGQPNGQVDFFQIFGGVAATGAVEAPTIKAIGVGGDFYGVFFATTATNPGNVLIEGSIETSGQIYWVGTLQSLTVNKSDGGYVQDFTNIENMSIADYQTPTSTIKAANIHDLAVGLVLAGNVAASSNLDLLVVGQSIIGTYSAAHLGTVIVDGVVIYPPSGPSPIRAFSVSRGAMIAALAAPATSARVTIGSSAVGRGRSLPFASTKTNKDRPSRGPREIRPILAAEGRRQDARRPLR